MTESSKRFRITVEGLSGCCGAQLEIVRSQHGGKITKNCASCSRPFPVRYHEFIEEVAPRFEVPCPCGEIMQPAIVRYGTYGYACGCDRTTHVADFLPWYYETASEFDAA